MKEFDSKIEELAYLLEKIQKIGKELGYSNIFDNYNHRLPFISSIILKNNVFDNFMLNPGRTGRDAYADNYKNIEIKTNTLTTLTITENSMEMQFDKQNDSIRREETLNYNAFVSSVYAKEEASPILTVIFKSNNAIDYINNKIREEQEKFLLCYENSLKENKRIRDNISLKPLKFVNDLKEEDIEIFYKSEKVSKKTFLSKILNKRIKNIEI
jgi:hypothetical protein